MDYKFDDCQKGCKNVEFAKSGKVDSPVKEEEDRDRNETI